MAPSMTMMPSGGSAPDAELPKLATGRCTECEEDNVVLDGLLARHFHLNVCVMCKQDRNLRSGLYELIPKSKAKTEYALPDSCFHGIPFVAKPNPRHESFAPLKLYLKKMIIDEAKRLYGGDEALENEKASRKRKSYERAATRTKHLMKKRQILSLTSSSAAGIGERTASHDNVEEKAVPVYVPVADRDHQHQFATDYFDGAVNSWVKECACGMKVHFEKW